MLPRAAGGYFNEVRGGITAALFSGLLALAGCYSGGALDEDGGSDGTGEDGDSGGEDGGTVDIDPASLPKPLATRLTDVQLRFTVLDLFDEELTEQELTLLPRDVPIEGAYSTSSDAQGFGSQHVLAYAKIARALTERMDLAELQMEFGGCQGLDDACLDAFIDELGLRMFRRRLLEEEHQAFVDLSTEIDSFPGAEADDVVAGIVQAMFQSPQFLYRLEDETKNDPDTVRRADGYELASRLSYFLWQSTPDPELLAFAAGTDGNGALDLDGMGAQVERMIADQKFGRARSLFWGDYSLASTSSFGTDDPELAAELQESLVASLEHISGASGAPQSLSAVFNGSELVMGPAVAALAGAESLGPGMQVYDTSLTEERLGIVTHPAFIAAIATTSFVGRGVFMSERLLCQHVGSPPAEFSEEIMSTAQSTEGMTPREASEFRFELEPICQSCHFQFEPIAYGFERYDMQGRFTLVDDQGRDLYSDGTLPPFGDRPEIEFETPQELLEALGDDPSVFRCFVENMAEFGTGHRAVWSGEFLNDATDSFNADDSTFDALVRSIADGEQITYIRHVEAQ